VGDDQILVDHGPHIVIGQLLHLLDFVRGAETVKEMHKRNARGQGAWVEISAISWASWTFWEHSMPQPVWRRP
jgi:hypothetical protein